MTHVIVHTDGACSGNPGPGGWGCVLRSGKFQRRLSGYEASTTNNRMELEAVIQALKTLKAPCKVDVYTDSTYVKNAFTEGWLENWKKNNWRTASKKPVKNKDQWVELCFLAKTHVLNWHWVKGHSGDEFNEICDSLAREAIHQKAGSDERIE